jgi:hypothetical protein
VTPDPMREALERIAAYEPKEHYPVGAFVVADILRDIARDALAAPRPDPLTADDLEAYIDEALIQWGDDTAGTARLSEYIAQSLAARLTAESSP